MIEIITRMLKDFTSTNFLSFLRALFLAFLYFQDKKDSILLKTLKKVIKFEFDSEKLKFKDQTETLEFFFSIVEAIFIFLLENKEG